MSFYNFPEDSLTPLPRPMDLVFTPQQVAEAIADIESALGGYFIEAQQVGSSYILGKGQDLDIVVRVSSMLHAADKFRAADYIYTGADSGEEDDFYTLRKGDVNVMYTSHEDFIDNFVKAAEVCKALGLTTKWQRVAVHRVLMNDEDADVAVKAAKDAYPD